MADTMYDSQSKLNYIRCWETGAAIGVASNKKDIEEYP